ncbi:MAG: 30S ribosome-binding factor RbfA [Clostridia bacterium]|nr:30S ribosome-binding factor RbfA [Clostridia bacterium]
MNHRQERINDSVARTLGEIFRTVKDPRVSGAFITVNAARVTPDLKFAKVYYGVITGEPEQVQKGLECAAGFIRSSLATKLNLRQTPELTFIHDRSAEHGAHIARVLKELNADETNN